MQRVYVIKRRSGDVGVMLGEHDPLAIIPTEEQAADWLEKQGFKKTDDEWYCVREKGHTVCGTYERNYIMYPLIF